jgi:type II secretory pathway component PulK
MISRSQAGRATRQPVAVPRRRGLVVVAALVCLLIVTSIVTSMLRHTLDVRRHLRAERDRRQVELLVAAGVSRAVQRIAADARFRGDTWNLRADEIVGRGDARVTSNIAAAENDGWQVHVVAEYPLGRDFPIRRSRTFSIPRSSNQ